MKWKDTTGYSRGERGSIEPRSWELEHGDLFGRRDRYR